MASGHSHFIVHHVHTGKQKNPGEEKIIITVLNTD